MLTLHRASSVSVCISAAGVLSVAVLVVQEAPSCSCSSLQVQPDAHWSCIHNYARVVCRMCIFFCLTGHHTLLAMSWKDAAVMLQEDACPQWGWQGPPDCGSGSAACSCLRVLHWPDFNTHHPCWEGICHSIVLGSAQMQAGDWPHVNSLWIGL